MYIDIFIILLFFVSGKTLQSNSRHLFKTNNILRKANRGKCDLKFHKFKSVRNKSGSKHLVLFNYKINYKIKNYHLL